MTVYVAFLRGVNAGGRGNLPMADLQALCAGTGLANVRTYLQSGNVLFESSLPEKTLIRQIDRAVSDKLRRPVGVLIRSAAELRAVRDANPFPDSHPSLVGVMFIPKALPVRLLTDLELDGPEDVQLIGREVFVHYPDGISRSKIKIPFANDGTTRMLDTVGELVELAEA
jgi:uncharacterized protein (DUF1697 family)